MSSRLNILFADNDEDIGPIVQLALGLDREIAVVFADSGKAALSLLQRSPQFNLILLDYMLPDVNGADILKTVRCDPRFDTIPIAFLTARTRAVDRDHLLDIGADAVLAKPFDPMTLAQVIRTIGRRLIGGDTRQPPSDSAGLSI